MRKINSLVLSNGEQIVCNERGYDGSIMFRGEIEEFNKGNEVWYRRKPIDKTHNNFEFNGRYVIKVEYTETD